MRTVRITLGLLAWALLGAPIVHASSLRIQFAEAAYDGPLSGRLLVLISRDGADEPRNQVSLGLSTAQVFGADVERWAPGVAVTVEDGEFFGYPIGLLPKMPAGDYWVQAVLHRYGTFARAVGPPVLLPASWEAGQAWNREPANLYSKPLQVRLADDAAAIEITLDQVIPPDARYPLMVFHGHFPADFGGFRTEPPDPELECEYSERFQVDCYNRIQQQEAYDFYRQWIGPDFPCFLVVEIQHANPFYDDSYAVNSANLGPYGDAIVHELIPHIEKTFRGLGEGWARFLYGGSTGGWEALAAQVFYPDEFNAHSPPARTRSISAPT